MRVEMLGASFTAQHSDARVLDQLVYKWDHARHVVSQVLATKYSELLQTGWDISSDEVRRDVRLLLGGSYEEFMAMSL